VSTARRLRLALGDDIKWLEPTVEKAGAELVEPGQAEALVWGLMPSGRLAEILAANPAIRWVQLVQAGVENHASLFGDGRLWTSGKGESAEPVSEHTLMLLLAGFRDLKARALARSWGQRGGRTLYDRRVTIVGGGGIAHELLRLLAPFRVHATVVRKHPEPVAGAERVVGADSLRAALEEADAVVLAVATTPETRGMIDAAAFQAMGNRCWFVNVARGTLVVTDDLVTALREAWIGGAALDVTDPEPLPDDHPLWGFPNCLITPHTSNPPSTARAAVEQRVGSNIQNYIGGRPLLAVVDAELGY
jgi:phosphoglycerate dehydrogenase-like enzyme